MCGEQFDQASVLYLMEHHVPGQINAVPGGWKLKDRIDRAVFLLNGLTYQDCKVPSPFLFASVSTLLPASPLCVRLSLQSELVHAACLTVSCAPRRMQWQAESVTAAALYEWNTLVVDMHRLCKDV